MASQARVVEIRTYPVKSMDGSAVAGSEITTAGLTGDRAWSVVDAEGAVLTSRQAPELRAVRVAATVHGPRLDVPGIADGVVGRAADDALTAYVGAPVRIQPAGDSGQEGAAVHLVSRQAVAAAIGTTSDDPACDIEAPRANLMLDLGGTPPADFERAWVGHEIAIGDVVLMVNQVPKHCLGVYAEVVRPGRINSGDPVEVRD
jgi:uncharacterized protein